METIARHAIRAALWMVVTGCSVEAQNDSSAPAVVEQGTLTIQWSVEGRKDPSYCSDIGLSAIRIAINQGTDQSAGAYQQGCATFATSIPLPAGTYTASALMLDAQGAARTTFFPIRRFTIIGDTELIIPIDFPTSSLQLDR